MLRSRDKVEVALLPVAVLSVGAVSRWLPPSLALGDLIAIACLAWLVQGGIRDLCVLAQLKRQGFTAPRRRLACMCFESTLGFAGFVLGMVLSLFDFGQQVRMDPLRWMLLASAIFPIGFLVKDLVISWHPLGLRHDPDHHSIVFTWW